MASTGTGHLPPTWFRDVAGYRFRGPRPAWHFGPARPSRGRIAPCGIGLVSGYEVAREPIGGRVCKACQCAANVFGPWLVDDDDLSQAVFVVEVPRG